jgi:hypothetical protein
MNQAIANIIKESIEDLDFVDKIAGLVSTQYMNIEGVTKSYPVACCVLDTCKTGDYNDLAPDSKYKSVIYFEDGGVSFVRAQGNFKYYQSRLRLVGWLNVKAILGDECDASQCTYSSHAIMDIIRLLPEFPQNIAPFTRVYMEVTSQAIRDKAIFSKYTYNELQTQYLMSPYDYFALDITTTFGICLPGNQVYNSCDDIVVSVTDCVNGITDDSGDIIIE